MGNIITYAYINNKEKYSKKKYKFSKSKTNTEDKKKVFSKVNNKN